jgi:hypothetical protein
MKVSTGLTRARRSAAALAPARCFVFLHLLHFLEEGRLAFIACACSSAA